MSLGLCLVLAIALLIWESHCQKRFKW